ncbi:MAG: hypothetical protein QW614_00375 [Candidatus Caldarchaeum sp.]|uniref:Uncharacterized protein n=1 Tax=Caldiarchaeum subterraneum TaxID=311458 RepID=A0A7C5Q9X9_CALS0
MKEVNPVVKMLKWKTRLLAEDEIMQVLAAVANIDKTPFTLTDLTEILPDSLSRDEKKRRSISTFLTNLVEVGYLSKPSERKWTKNAATFSRYLSPLLIELNEIEKNPPAREKQEKKIIQLEGRR